jgi:hypothetical protein
LVPTLDGRVGRTESGSSRTQVSSAHSPKIRSNGRTPALAQGVREQSDDSRSGEDGLPEGMDEGSSEEVNEFLVPEVDPNCVIISEHGCS